MPETVDVVAKELHVLVEMTSKEVIQLEKALCMCAGGPGVNEEERQAWQYFIDDFYPYVRKLKERLMNDGN